MNNPTRTGSRKDLPVLSGTSVVAVPGREKQIRRYVPPTIQTFTEEEILQEVGPAQGYNGSIPGVTNSF
ncbi:MAG: hypothetical protein ACE5HD_07415 [Acidobacteriota bacterium]